MKIVDRLLIATAACLLGIAFWAPLSLGASESFTVSLTGAQEVPGVETTGMGTADLAYDTKTRVIRWTVAYSGLSGLVTMAHFHGPAAEGKNGPVQIWLTEKGNSVDSPIKGHATLTPEQAEQFKAGEWYINLHTQAHPAGEIRGQVIPPKS